MLASFTDLGADAGVEFARRVTDDLLGRFARGEVDRVELLYTHFLSALRREVTHETFLPIGADGAADAPGGAAADIIFEPGLEPIFAALLPRFATARMLAALADSRASEEGARMAAMGAANKNAGELLDLLVLQRNRLRQSMITREILDIVGGAEALDLGYDAGARRPRARGWRTTMNVGRVVQVIGPTVDVAFEPGQAAPHPQRHPASRTPRGAST